MEDAPKKRVRRIRKKGGGMMLLLWRRRRRRQWYKHAASPRVGRAAAAEGSDPSHFVFMPVHSSGRLSFILYLPFYSSSSTSSLTLGCWLSRCLGVCPRIIRVQFSRSGRQSLVAPTILLVVPLASLLLDSRVPSRSRSLESS